ncbi:hypothetical protein Tco_0508727 [Tanacetum coccineum]
MDNSKCGYIPMQEKLNLNKTQGAIYWKSSKQSTTAMSTIEAKYIAASKAAMEVVWIRKFILGLGIVPTINEPIKMFCDNLIALPLAYEPRVQKGTRHYYRIYHYVRECIEFGKIKLLEVHTNDNLADPFTKALSKGRLTQHARSMGLRLASSFMINYEASDVAPVVNIEFVHSIVEGFERTTVLQRLENCLVIIQKKYWSTNCQHIGYAKRIKYAPDAKPKPSVGDLSDEDIVSPGNNTNSSKTEVVRPIRNSAASKSVEYIQHDAMREACASTSRKSPFQASSSFKVVKESTNSL